MANPLECGLLNINILLYLPRSAVMQYKTFIWSENYLFFTAVQIVCIFVDHDNMYQICWI